MSELTSASSGVRLTWRSSIGPSSRRLVANGEVVELDGLRAESGPRRERDGSSSVGEARHRSTTMEGEGASLGRRRRRGWPLGCRQSPGVADGDRQASGSPRDAQR